MPRILGGFEVWIAGTRVPTIGHRITDVTIVLAVPGRVVLGHGRARRSRRLVDQRAMIARDVAYVHVESAAGTDLEPARAHTAHRTERNFSRFWRRVGHGRP